ncbi:MAG: sulfatase [Lentisphaeraceae bacterium]|nr:sulfatase [Lentisphaeraceae bacterium]
MKKVVVLSLLFLSCLNLKAEQKLNFLFFLVDDLGKMDIGIEGSSFYETPHIDALAKSGMRFQNGYAACQVCSPSRAAIMLGTYPARNKITDWIGAKTSTNWKRNDKVLPSEYIHALPKEDTTLAEAMQEGGYKTFFAGKWHMGGESNFPEDHGFDINIGGHHRGSPPGGFFSPYTNPKMKSGPKGESLTLRLANDTANFIESQKGKEQPFFAYLSFYAVHGPIQTTEELWKKYQKKAVAKGLAEKRFIFDRTKAVRQVQDNPVYAGMMETLDDAIGVVMAKLKETGQDKNTVVIFTGDNGGVSSGDAFSTSSLPFRGGKGRQWEGGIREPYYIYVPGLTKEGSITEVPATGTDFYPTILELAGLKLKPNQHQDGVSLVPLFKGENISKRDLFWHYPHYGNQGGEPSSIIRSGNWKLIHYYEDGRDELYNLSSDIGEQTDVLKQNPEMAKQLRQKLNSWLKETDARIPQQDSRFNAKLKEKQLKDASTKHMNNLEKRHANYLKPDYKPNKTWWDSKIPKD